MRKIGLILGVVVGAGLCVTSVCAAGITHTNSYKAPLVVAFPGDLSEQGCGVEYSTTATCSGPASAAIDTSF